MKKNEIKKMVEQVVGVEYIAEDGQIFYNEEECKKYEESSLFIIRKKLKRLNVKDISIYDLFDEGSINDEVEIFDIQTDKDLENLRKYLYLKATSNGATETSIQGAFTSKDGKRNDYVFDNVTVGHEVIICWSHKYDWFWVYRDGSINGLLNYLKDKITKLITSET